MDLNNDWLKTENKVKEFLIEHNHIVMEVVHRLYYSGGVDREDYDPEEYALAKVLLTAALRDRKNVFAPVDRKMLEDVRNLKYF